jgi:hypothetical protein
MLWPQQDAFVKKSAGIQKAKSPDASGDLGNSNDG